MRITGHASTFLMQPVVLFSAEVSKRDPVIDTHKYIPEQQLPLPGEGDVSGQADMRSIALQVAHRVQDYKQPEDTFGSDSESD